MQITTFGGQPALSFELDPRHVELIVQGFSAGGKLKAVGTPDEKSGDYYNLKELPVGAEQREYRAQDAPHL